MEGLLKTSVLPHRNYCLFLSHINQYLPELINKQVTWSLYFISCYFLCECYKTILYITVSYTKLWVFIIIYGQRRTLPMNIFKEFLGLLTQT